VVEHDAPDPHGWRPLAESFPLDQRVLAKRLASQLLPQLGRKVLAANVFGGNLFDFHSHTFNFV
jgi:hypothetical protein